MYTIDASVHLSALNPYESESAASQAFLDLVRQRRIPLFCPTLLPVEVAAAIARTMPTDVLDGAGRAVALANTLRGLPNQTLVPLDDALAGVAIDLAAALRLRGADAVYAAVAQQYGTTLITLDRQQLERLPPAVRTARPGNVLPDLQAE
jgi:predicted nucleic acid-binding protein